MVIKSKNEKKENSGYTTAWGEIPEHLKFYIANEVRKFKIQIIEYTANASAFISFVTVLSLVFFVFLVFISITIALTIGEALGSLSVGFLIVSLIYIVLFSCIIIFRKNLIFKPIRNFVAREVAEALELNKEDKKNQKIEEHENY
jgi:hypothetical protein